MALVVLLGFWARATAAAGWSFGLDRLLAGTRRAWLTEAADVVQTAFFNDVGAAVMVIVAVGLLVRRRWWRAARVVGLFVVVFSLTLAVRAIFDVDRPPLGVQAVAAVRSPSYPSGHVAVAAALTAIVLLTFGGVARLVVGGSGVVLTAVVAYSRLYLGVHTLNDVLGAILIAVGAFLMVGALSPADGSGRPEPDEARHPVDVG